MIQMRPDAREPDGLRFSYSPLWECVAAFRTLRKADPGVHLPWVRMARPPADEARSITIRQLLLTESGYIPDFIAPPPLRPLPTFEEEVKGLRKTAPRVVRAELHAAYPGGLPRPLASLARDPARLVEEVAGSLEVFWKACILPYWARVRGVLERDISFRSREQALGGPRAVLEGLHPAARAHGSMLRMANAARRRALSGTEDLLLVPSVFGWPDAFVVSSAPWRLTLAYPARGVQYMWDARRGSTGPRVASLLGATTGRLAGLLHEPATTQELASRLRMTPGAISQHLQRLHRADILERERIGPKVFYRLSERGIRLMEALE